MDLHLAGARAVITGGSQGLGLAIAHRLAKEGAHIGLIARNAERLAAAQSEVAKRGGMVVTFAVDVSDSFGLRAAVDEIAAELGGLDHVVANAGGTVGGDILGTPPEQVASNLAGTLALNVVHAAALISAAVPHMVTGGSAVVISSVSALRATPRSTYATAKAAEISLAVNLAHELAAQSIRVNAVTPGSLLIDGGGWDEFRQWHPEDYRDWVAAEFPWGRLGTADEVADVVGFLLSDRASWITGTNIAVDGGQGRPSVRSFPTRPPD